MPPYAVSRLALIQVCVVFFGVLFTSVFLRLTQLAHVGRTLPGLALMVQHYGTWLFLLPLAWTAAATLSVRQVDRLPEVRHRWMVIGYVLLVGLAVGLVATTISAMMAATTQVSPMQGG